MAITTKVQLINPLLIQSLPEPAMKASVVWNEEQAKHCPTYPQCPDIYPGIYTLHSITANVSELVISVLRGNVIVHCDNAYIRANY